MDLQLPRKLLSIRSLHTNNLHRDNSINRDKFSAVTFLIFVTASFFIIFFIDPFQYDLFLPCWFHSLTGLDCPGCGGIRGTHLFLHGHFLLAIKSNILLIIAIPLVIYLTLYNTLVLFSKHRIPKIPTPNWLIYTGIFIILLHTLLRNL
ncbi:MAG: DUF2752 domain-containing protein [Ignavibacteriales bacterium]|nr:DUF2752 domain-containing protein [Ignavibacteriales bacterium]